MKISLFYDHVTVLDYAYLDDHRGPVGNSLIVDVEFIGKTDHEGILYDFSYAKKKVKEIIDRDCDHRLVVPKGLLKTKGNYSELNYTFGFNNDALNYKAPNQAFCEIPHSYVSYENLKSYLEEVILKEMPKNVLAIKLKFREEVNADNNVYFHYTHGLKDHYGNCQRLIHGHRSTLKVLINGVRSAAAEEDLCFNYFSQNIHFVFWENVVNKDEIMKAMKEKKVVGRLDNVSSVHLKYKGNQGNFEMTIPAFCCYILQVETTVENLAIHFGHLVKSKLNKNDQVQAFGYEGIAKGAISTLL